MTKISCVENILEVIAICTVSIGMLIFLVGFLMGIIGFLFY